MRNSGTGLNSIRIRFLLESDCCSTSVFFVHARKIKSFFFKPSGKLIDDLVRHVPDCWYSVSVSAPNDHKSVFYSVVTPNTHGEPPNNHK